MKLFFSLNNFYEEPQNLHENISDILLSRIYFVSSNLCLPIIKSINENEAVLMSKEE